MGVCLFFSLILGKTEPNQTNAYESDDDFLQSALEDSLRLKAPENPPAVIPKRSNNNKSIVSSKINTVDNFRKNENDSDDDDEGDQSLFITKKYNKNTIFLFP